MTAVELMRASRKQVLTEREGGAGLEGGQPALHYELR